MKKFFISFIVGISLIFLFIPSFVLATKEGDTCSANGEISDCTCPTHNPAGGKPITCCCLCAQKKWSFVDEKSCAIQGIPPGAGEQIVNPVLNKFGVGKGETIIAELIANALKITFSLSGLILLGMLIWGAFEWMSSAGNQEAYAKAQRKITSALIGFVIYMSAFAIINFILPALGIKLDLLNINWPTP